MRRYLASAALAVVFSLITGFVPTPVAQRPPAKSDRKVLISGKPQYPEPLKQAQIGGLVRLRATVLPNGTVSKVDVLGGNPILAESAAAATKRWKFAPATSQTFEDITVNFNPRAE
jgi:TonB family protein